MMTVNEVSKITGVSVRTLQYYDNIGILHPTSYTEAGYRLYDDTAIEKLQQILLFKELEFSLKEIKKIIYSENFDKNKALEQQIEILTLKKEHFENLINFAKTIKDKGENKMNFDIFNKTKIEEYTKKAKEQWQHTPEYKEFEEKTKNYSNYKQQEIYRNFMSIFIELGNMKESNPNDEQVQLKIKKLQNYISTNFYKCSNDILKQLGKIYASGGEFTKNIDKVASNGTADFVAKAIEIYCK